MACLYLLRGGPIYEFHEFAMLSINHHLDSLMKISWRFHLEDKKLKFFIQFSLEGTFQSTIYT
jgi:hypothetical protein